jgi:hypothetical protein
LHEDSPLQIKDRVRDARGERSLIEAEAGRARRVVGGSNDAAWPIVTFRGNRGEIVDDFPLVPHVVAGSKDVGAEVKQVLGDRGREAESPGGIFSIHDDQIDLAFLDKVGQMFPDNASPRTTKNVPDKE